LKADESRQILMRSLRAPPPPDASPTRRSLRQPPTHLPSISIPDDEWSDVEEFSAPSEPALRSLSTSAEPRKIEEPVESEDPDLPLPDAVFNSDSDYESIEDEDGRPEDGGEPISEANPFLESGGLDEAVDPGESTQFFETSRIVFEFIENEPNALGRWDCDYSRVLKVNVVESQIEGFESGVFRVIVRAQAVSQVKQEGDRFVMGQPFHAFGFNEAVYILAPNVSDKC
jgi:hypothetical protein